MKYKARITIVVEANDRTVAQRQLEGLTQKITSAEFKYAHGFDIEAAFLSTAPKVTT